MNDFIPSENSFVKTYSDICFHIRPSAGKFSTAKSTLSKSSTILSMKHITKNISENIVHVTTFEMIFPITSISGISGISVICAFLRTTSIKRRMTKLII